MSVAQNRLEWGHRPRSGSTSARSLDNHSGLTWVETVGPAGRPIGHRTSPENRFQTGDRPQIGPLEQRFPQVDVQHLRAGQRGGAEVATSQRCPGEIAAVKDRAGQVGPIESSRRQVGTGEIPAGKLETLESASPKVGITQIDTVELVLCRLAPSQLNPGRVPLGRGRASGTHPLLVLGPTAPLLGHGRHDEDDAANGTDARHRADGCDRNV
jgi:hypothetical protein